MLSGRLQSSRQCWPPVCRPLHNTHRIHPSRHTAAPPACGPQRSQKARTSTRSNSSHKRNELFSSAHFCPMLLPRRLRCPTIRKVRDLVEALSSLKAEASTHVKCLRLCTIPYRCVRWHFIGCRIKLQTCLPWRIRPLLDSPAHR